MIHVIATVELNPDCREKFLEIFQRNVPHVKQEKGCLAYAPTVDVDSGIPAQGELRDHVVTVVEVWEDLEALHAHLKAPHMRAYREEVKDLVKSLGLQVLQPV
ncbi:MAG: antibiotic biosynthesis monooxygenase [Desulfobacterales bacterium]|nr:MAG: antibiotic biosynthesis monooxygenase [Desulfobacterales bacterium]